MEHGHIATHGVSRAEAEHVVWNATAPFPRDAGGDNLMVWGSTAGGKLLQIIFAYRKSEVVEMESLTPDKWRQIQAAILRRYENANMGLSGRTACDVLLYVVHAMPLPAKLLRQYHRLRR